MKTVKITAKDGYELTAHLFEPKQPNQYFLLINSATGVKQQMYFGLANYLAELGITVLTYDYRGVGLSKPKKLKKFDASMRSWGALDYDAVADYVFKNFPNSHYVLLGHSVGALIVGMSSYSKRMDDFIFVATQNPYYPYLAPSVRLFGLFGFGFLQPIVSSTLGYFPGHWFGLGETLPSGCAADWRQIILKKESTNILLNQVEDYSKDLHQDVLFIHAEDDTWVTDKGINSLLNDTYSNLKSERRLLKISESEKGEIGHVNFFRSYNQNLWKIVSDQILK